MFIPYNRIAEMLRLLAIFVFCTFIFYCIISYLNDAIRPAQPYKEPQGKAVKVMNDVPSLKKTYQEMKQRLFAFYWYGE
ncbi:MULTISPECIES: DUF4227 family protein [Aneurinibacillus]|jgi:hypothetical protein|uniref:YqzK family protein n=1 Tax=Aneurinibacillus thermoaerophilus TaxID=143495 RepID=A0A1G7XPF1_ANETH|nr:MULTISPECIES: DUF4227 family protein [Aneurinibacillus]AMA73677.1 hypothetical protein ACH33_12955 [Aneurinibacillus sp. XH2]MED0677430.1 DUF4227 family protein [Aneurinibacillus thermoaerophilus]MED0679519.1 DUF4227 family protein [Aneurinibacillus thermoaerophilus]MED0737480.1 DUF4227 family protein [Aneurinibacillus thermoaerophilus]MED0756332.1 DUF4227 family protein [Aneurinibacillus thermoaerophilus]